MDARETLNTTEKTARITMTASNWGGFHLFLNAGGDLGKLARPESHFRKRRWEWPELTPAV